ncbi:RNA polymerase sigma factor [Azospirillum sp. ST 5-10]|uniref:RNA polymerase sigma factor n=1 Tax=unclassified Azospirillum TaxID=2630922 RepID=UPI003F4A7367
MATLDVNGLFRRYRDDLMRYLCRRVPCREDAADLVQECFMRLMRGAPAAVEVKDAGAYLFTTAARLAIDHHRHGRVARPAADGDAVLAGLPAPAPSPETAAADREELARAMAAIAALPERTRRAFEMHRLGGRTQTEIARELGVSVTVVWRMIHDGYAALRQALNEAPEA